MNELKEFFHMGGYAFYVWTSYGLAFVVLAAIMIGPILNERQIIRSLARKARRKNNDPKA